ncbi:MAG: GWxTD domain-containing protein [Acidobacteriota bacterium]
MSRLPFSLIWVLFFAPAFAFQQENIGEIREEEKQDYYQKWLAEDVVYIISDEEKAVFGKLTTDEEREQFIEQLWFRRDPDPRTSVNEFKEEHYRRIAYANEHFASGDPGWVTDRGIIYIIHGPPDNIESRPTGGFYQRQMSEGGGTTSVYPFETWRYRYIEGMGEDIILEFVDSTFTGKYQLAVYDWEKDALMHFPGAGRTLAEQTGLAERADRPAFMPAAGGHGFNPNMMYARLRDMPFARYEQVAKIQAPTPLKYPDLKELVEVNIEYTNLPFEYHANYFKLNDEKVLVPITLRLRNKFLTFKPEGEMQVARLAIYGIITSMTNRIVMEFDDDVVTSFRQNSMEVGLQKSSIYQKVVPLARNMRYRLDLVVKDLNSGHVGVTQKGIIPPPYSEEDLSGSSLVISDFIEPLERIPDQDEMFVLGDVKIRPNMDNVFSQRMPLGVYFQVYNAALDQSTLNPALKVNYKLLKNGDLLREAADSNGESTQFFSGRRVVLLKKLSLEGLEPGTYEIVLEVTDQLTSQTVTAAQQFTIVDEQKLALGN